MSYVLITPAHNEEATIEKTIQSVIKQTVLPLRWIIVSDGSTDRTDDIVQKYSKTYEWIRLIRLPERKERNFAAKVEAFNAGYNLLREIEYDIIGNLDADITFEKDYFEFLLEKFEQDSLLGVTGTPFVEDGSHYDYNFTNIEHVSGACQLFWRECFESIGGYFPLKEGGIDWIAVTTARMNGWHTRTFTEKVCYHHRKVGTGNASSIGAWIKRGRKDYLLGGHPVWQLFRIFYQMKNKPYVLSGLFLFLGYALAVIRRKERPVSQELMSFYRKEQMNRLHNILFRPRKD
ncbi:MAG: glycosyltransferase family 2 protein [Spirochaetes bacterium]|nr:glycosyltransferase family 2 protein [Spirochaetota bacterium]